MTRVLIDCAHIDFRRQPTGIPRVVLRYIEEGYRWAAGNGHEVIPVVPTDTGIWLCRPVPGASPPPGLVQRAERSERWESAHATSRVGNLASGPGALDARHPPHQIVPGLGDVLFSPAYWHDNNAQLYINIRNSGCKVVTLVHDILPITHSAFYLAPWHHRFAAAVLQAIGYSDALYCVSGVTRSAVQDFASSRGRTLPPTVVVHNGYQPLLDATTAARIDTDRLRPHTTDEHALEAMALDETLLMVGSIEPKKGHVPVVKCLEAMWAAGYQRPLVIVGRRGWLEESIVDYIRASPAYGTRLFWLTDIDDFDLAFVYRRCRALIFASIAEGFGIPMIEAAEFGKPVVVLDTPIAREVLGDYGLTFDDDHSFLLRLLALEDADAYRQACAKMETFQWPTWSECAPPVFDSLLALVAAGVR